MATRIDAAIPPANPSSVFFGLSHSIILLRPIAMPVKYAPTSAAHMPM